MAKDFFKLQAVELIELSAKARADGRDFHEPG
jgi:hypothetical protein